MNDSEIELQYLAHEATKYLTKIISKTRLLLDDPSFAESVLSGTEADRVSLLCDAGEMLIGVILSHYGLESGELTGSDLNDFLDHVLVSGEGDGDA